MTVTITPADKPVVPAGYSNEDVAQTKALADAFRDQLVGVKGHVAMSAVLTTFTAMVNGYGPAARFRAGQHLMTVGGNIANAAIDDGARREGDKKTAPELAQQISNAIASEGHAMGLEALLIVFNAIALRFPCCIHSAADNAAKTAAALATAAALTRPGESHQVH